jgi:hypothetical protein
MEKEFIPYQQSVDMKELGFDEPCFGIHFEEGLNPFLMFASQYGEEGASANGGILAPTFSQAFRFFREKHNIISSVRTNFNEEFFYEIYVDVMNEITSNYYKTYEEAELGCIEKLIELTKNK